MPVRAMIKHYRHEFEAMIDKGYDPYKRTNFWVLLNRATQQVMLNAREVKSIDEIMLLDTNLPAASGPRLTRVQADICDRSVRAKIAVHIPDKVDVQAP